MKGKIVVCNGTSNGVAEAYRVGALGSIVQNDAEHNFSGVLPFPASVLSAQDVSLVKAYVKSTKYFFSLVLFLFSFFRFKTLMEYHCLLEILLQIY